MPDSFQQGTGRTSGEISDKSRATAFLLCYFLGLFGVHRFYVGKILTGLLMLITLGGLGIWMLVDAVLIVAGQMKDGAGLPLRSGPPDPANPQAGFWVRFAAISVDGVILNLIVSVVFTGLTLLLPLLGMGALLENLDADLSSLAGDEEAMMAQVEQLGVAMSAAFGLLALISVPLYFGIQHGSRHQATIGKRCFDICVSRVSGERVSYGRGIWRGVCYLFSALPLYLGFVMAAFTGEKRALHDFLAGTRVRYVEEPHASSAPAPVASRNSSMARETSPGPESVRPGTGLIVAGACLLAGAAMLLFLA